MRESDLLEARAELRDAARRYAKRTEQWRELKRAAKRRTGVLGRRRAMSLRYLPLEECRRIATLDADPVERAAAFADACRLNALYMIERAGSGHPGTTFSSLDVVAWLHLEVLGDGDRYFSSKGHDVPGALRGADRARAARLRADPPAAAAGRPARPPGRRGDARGA